MKYCPAGSNISAEQRAEILDRLAARGLPMKVVWPALSGQSILLCLFGDFARQGFFFGLAFASPPDRPGGATSGSAVFPKREEDDPHA